MRLDYLHFQKYGKFADVRVDFPQATHDFHLVVGPNEAGKSTLRSAIQDLLYGIPMRSPQDFLHELRHLSLGARVADAGKNLEFKRIKANADTLRDAGHAVIPDKELAAFLGATDRSFFAKMFALDHGLLIEGGRNLLDARSDLGQMLFQSAAGIAGLGKVRDALAAEAGKLWSSRRANDREYYIAQDKLQEASASLKSASLRAKAWADAHDQVEQIAAARATETAKLQELQARRNRLERLRRTAPYIATLTAAEAQLAAMGNVIDLPDDTGLRLDAAEKALAAAAQLVDLHAADEARAANTLAGLALDEAATAQAATIVALVERCHLVGNHDNDIRARESEVAALWREALAQAEQLGWTDLTEVALRRRLPPVPVRRSISESAIDHGRLAQALRSAQQAHAVKQEEIASLRGQLADSPAQAIHPTLRTTLAAARTMGDVATTMKQREAAAQAATRHLQTCLESLAPWTMPPAALLAQQLPSADAVTRLAHERQGLAAEFRSAQRLMADAESAQQQQALELSQFEELHQPASQEQVSTVRRARDAAWDALRDGVVTLKAGASAFETAIREADALADRRLGQAATAARLQELQHALARLTTAARLAADALPRLDAERDAAEQHWQALASAAGLARITPEVYPEWLVRRQAALAAATSGEQTRHALEELIREEKDARTALGMALKTSGQTIEHESLASLCEQADRVIAEADEERILREARQTHLHTAEVQATALALAYQAAVDDMTRWSTTWTASLAKAALAADTDIAAAKGALELVESIEEKRRKIDEIRQERIDTMKADLASLATLAANIANAIEPAHAMLPPLRIAQALQERLTTASQARAEAERLTRARDEAGMHKRRAEDAIREANAELAPLLLRAGVTSTGDLARAITASGEKSQLMSQVRQAQANFVSAADGLAREQIEADIAGADMAAVMAELHALEAELSDAVERQSVLAAQQAHAEQALAQMAGSDTAATAEARRQEALSQMSEAAERYVRVATAAKLLGWSIERYRERKQGPMLERASAIFKELTLGVFTRLHVDFEKETMVLEGERADRTKPVGVAGMSEGTRDQLYLALRLAALELHLGQATALPFIADDLFINYDDDRTRAGLRALKDLSTRTQVIFLSHHAHLENLVRDELGGDVSVCRMTR